jgi:SAM-dependent methyltransferase
VKRARRTPAWATPQPGRDRELEAGARAHYDDPAYYTSTYRTRDADVLFYVELARRVGGPVLEYGVGNGRIAVPIAREGIEVWGVDHSEPMLADLRARLSREPPEVARRVHAKRGDMRRARLGKRFPLVVCPFNAALHLYGRTDVEAFLARVREHLAPRGLFVVDLSTPALEDLTRDPTRAHHAPRFRHPTTGQVVKNWEYFDYDRWRQILFVSAVFEPVDDPRGAWTVPLAHRQFFPREWEALLHYNGFEVERVEGDFQGGPVDRRSDVTIWYARARRGWRPS